MLYSKNTNTESNTLDNINILDFNSVTTEDPSEDQCHPSLECHPLCIKRYTDKNGVSSNRRWIDENTVLL